VSVERAQALGATYRRRARSAAATTWVALAPGRPTLGGVDRLSLGLASKRT